METVTFPEEESPMEAKEQEPVTQRSRKRVQVTMVPLVEEGSSGDVGLESSYSWAVQVYSCQSLTQAKHLKDQLRLKGLPAYLIVGALDGETWYGVRVGFYDSQKEALEAGMKIASEFDTYEDYFAIQSQQGK